MELGDLGGAGKCFFFKGEDGIRDGTVTGVQTCALPISQFGGLIRSFPSTHSYTPAGHICAYRSATSRGTSKPGTRWDGMVSRVAFPERNTASSLLNVSLPSGANGAGTARVRAALASACIAIRPPGNRPPVSVIRPA